MSKIACFIIDTPILESYKSYYVWDAFTDAGYRLELIDVSPFLNRAAYNRVKVSLIDYTQGNVHLCKSYKELFGILKNLKEDVLVFDSTGWNVEHYPIYKYLSRRNIKYGYMILNSCYEVATEGGKVTRTKEYFSKLSWKRIINSIFIRLPKKLFPNQACAFVINNSPNEIENYRRRFYCDKKTKFLLIHSNMYEEALLHKDDAPVVKNNYCVWLDSYIPYHPDLANIGASVDATSYYSSLRKFFHWVQETYNIEVIISAHPRSDYEKHSDAYKGFRVIKNSTCLLVRDAKFVMTAASTSFLYAVTYKKPLLFIYQNALEEGLPSHIRFMIALSKEFDKSIINIDEFDYGNTSLIDEQLKINDVLYQKSAENYVKQNFDGAIRGESYKKEIIAFLEAL